MRCFVFFLFVLIQWFHTAKSTETKRETIKWNQTIEEFLLTTMDFDNFKPCENFYEYSCNNYQKNYQYDPIKAMQLNIQKFFYVELFDNILDDDVRNCFFFIKIVVDFIQIYFVNSTFTLNLT